MKPYRLAAAVVAFALLIGCRQGSLEQTAVALSGSSSMEEVVRALGEGFMERNANIIISPQFGGSSQGIRDVADGKADIGNISRELTDEEKKDLDGVTIALDGIAIIVHPDNRVAGLTLRQLADIYTGKVRNWDQVGGADLPIVAIGRDAASGTRTSFEALLGVSGQCLYGQEKDSSGGIKIAVEAAPGAVGYVSLEAAKADSRTKKIALEGVEASEKTIRDGDYPLARPLLMVVPKGEPLPMAAQAFLDYVLSQEGQEVIRSQSLVPVRR